MHSILLGIAISVVAGTGLLLTFLPWFSENPAPTKENVFKFTFVVTSIFVAYWVPITYTIIGWYENHPFYTAHYMEKYTAGTTVRVRLWTGMRKPKGDHFVEEPVVTKTPCPWLFKTSAVLAVVYVAVVTFGVPFTKEGTGTSESSFGWLFGMLYGGIIIGIFLMAATYICVVDRYYGDDKRKEQCEEVARERMRDELRSLLEKV
jgi:hypothetical protein